MSKDSNSTHSLTHSTWVFWQPNSVWDSKWRRIYEQEHSTISTRGEGLSAALHRQKRERNIPPAAPACTATTTTTPAPARPFGRSHHGGAKLFHLRVAPVVFLPPRDTASSPWVSAPKMSASCAIVIVSRQPMHSGSGWVMSLSIWRRGSCAPGKVSLSCFYLHISTEGACAQEGRISTFILEASSIHSAVKQRSLSREIKEPFDPPYHSHVSSVRRDKHLSPGRQPLLHPQTTMEYLLT